jgi:hypothetical protein
MKRVNIISVTIINIFYVHVHYCATSHVNPILLVSTDGNNVIL